MQKHTNEDVHWVIKNLKLAGYYCHVQHVRWEIPWVCEIPIGVYLGPTANHGEFLVLGYPWCGLHGIWI